MLAWLAKVPAVCGVPTRPHELTQMSSVRDAQMIDVGNWAGGRLSRAWKDDEHARRSIYNFANMLIF